MKESVFEEMKRYVGFDAKDAAQVQSLGELARPLIPKVVDRFYEQLMQHEQARKVFSGGEEQIQRQRGLLSTWMDELFDGAYDEAYHTNRLQIGRTHVRVGLPQHYMFTGMELIWQELVRRLRATGQGGIEEKIRSLHKLITLDLATMLESYKESYSELIRKSERQAVEEKLTRAEHLAEIGQLAASLAHEIKNPLAGISGAIQIIREATSANNPHRPILDEILGQIDRLDDVVKDLLLYARPALPRFGVISLDETINRVLRVLREEPALQRVRIEQKVGPPRELSAWADGAQIEQVLINLILNAAQATPDGGAIEVSCRSDGRHLCLTVRDTGSGMPEEVRKSAFEPFYTTKAKGTGLGLPICKRIVEAHGGTIELDSAPGRGTTVVVALPAAVTKNVEGRAGS